MGIIKLIILLLGITLLFLGTQLFFRIWGLIKTARPFMKHFQNSAQGAKSDQNSGTQMVKCEFCGLYLPKDQAYAKNSLYFCHADHASQYASKQKK